MKKLLILLTLFIISHDVVASQQKRTPYQRGTGSKKTLSRTSRARRASVQKTTITPAAKAPVIRKRGVALKQRNVQSVAKPNNIDGLVWENLTDKQQESFNSLKQSFERTVGTVSKNRSLWKKSVIELAKKIISINILLKDYCIEVISAELEESAEERGVGALAIAEIQSSLDEYAEQVQEKTVQTEQHNLQAARETLLSEGTVKEQFAMLMKKENVWRDFEDENKPAKEWANAVINRGAALIYSQQMNANEVQVSIVKVLRDAQIKGNIAAYATGLMRYINEKVSQKRDQMNPERVNSVYLTLMSEIERPENWDRVANRPTSQWIAYIIKAAQNMMKVFNMPIDELERQVGAQMFFVAVNKVNRTLSSQEKEEMMALIRGIKSRIQQQ